MTSPLPTQAPTTGNNSKPPAASPPNRGARKLASNRAMDISELLNFTLPPRQSQAPQSIPRRSRKTAQTFGVWNKEKFVNAQYRFVMKPTGDYTVHFADPDIFFQWQDILQVIIPRTSALAAAADSQGGHGAHEEGHTTCPICLSPPTAPRMTKCGHVFCFPCILHYLSNSERSKWNRCPICFDSINETQLKSVKWFDLATTEPFSDTHEAHSSSSQADPTDQSDEVPRPGSILHMRLMQRPQITTLALPRSCTWPSDALPPHQAPFHFLPDVFRFARFMLATPAYMIESLSRDLDELEAERRALVNDPISGIFIDDAEERVRRQLAKAAALETNDVMEAIARAEQDILDIEQRHKQSKAEVEKREPTQEVLGEIPDAFLATQQIGLPAVQAPVLRPANSRNHRHRRNLNPPPPSTSTYYYYQATSGAPIFLHPLDIRVLLAHFSSYAAFPDAIAVRVEAVAEGAVNDDLRKRCKYLAHVPEGADVVFVEADLAGVVGAEGLKNFEGALKTRRAKRKEKERKDERARLRAEERERERGRELRAEVAESVVTPSLVQAYSPDLVFPTSPIMVQAALPPEPQAQPAGAWGARSFASALHTTPSAQPARPANAQTRTAREREREEADEYDMDVAWHELERGGGGRRKRGNKLVILGGAGGRRR